MSHLKDNITTSMRFLKDTVTTTSMYGELRRSSIEVAEFHQQFRRLVKTPLGSCWTKELSSLRLVRGQVHQYWYGR